jgi:hypothetical protein
MGTLARIVPGLFSGMVAKRPAGSRTAHAGVAAGVGPTELGPLS